MMSSDLASPGVMTFNPSREEFKDFGRYVASIESQGAHRAGLAKVIPPKGWRARRCYDDLDDLVISAPIQQVVTGQSGLFTQYNIQKKPMTLQEFRKMSGLDKFRSPRYLDLEELERKFWKNLTFNPPLYGADVTGTLYDLDVTEWNIGRLNSILDTVEMESVGGSVTSPFLDFGMWKSAFAWHTEDMDLYSLSYLHFGEPRSWYAVPPEHGKRLERLAKGFFPGNTQSCEAFLRHKMTLMSPSILKKYGIPFEKVIQEAGQFIVSFPFCYRAGFNHGFNCVESANFATQRWIDYGKQTTLCSCRQDVVKIPMDVFVRKFQPDRYKLWKAGKDVAAVDHTKPSPDTVDHTKPEAEAVDHAKPEAEAVDHAKPKAEAVDHAKPKAVDHAKPEAEAVDHAKPKPEAVDHAKPEAEAVDHAKPKAEAVDHAKPKAVDHAKPEAEAVDHAKPKPEAVDHAKPEAEAIDHAKPEAVDHAKPEAEAVDHAKPSPDTVDHAKPQAEALDHTETFDHAKPTAEVINHGKPSPETVDHTETIDHAKPSPDVTEFLKKDVAAVDRAKAEAVEFLKKDKAGRLTEASRLKKANRLTEANRLTGSSDQDVNVSQDVKPEANSNVTMDREALEDVAVRHDVTLDMKEDMDEVESNKTKLSRKESPTKVACKPETVKLVKSASKKEKDTKPQSRPPHTRTSTKKTSTRRSPSKKDQNDVLGPDPSPPEEAEPCQDPPAHRVFQRTLSPLDVLHVHSYAKGDYGDGDGATEEESTDTTGLRQQGAEKKAADAGQEEDLGQLPGGHPLMKEEGHSDQDTLEQPPSPILQQDGLQGELWAKQLTHLWQNRPANLKKEREFNQNSASKPPYCSICSLFSTHHQAQCVAPPVTASGWMRTKPLIPESCFTTTTEEDLGQRPITPGLEADGTSVLVSCSQCSVRVHTSCYGVDPSSVSLEWKCARCTANAMTENCCLCALRGGALQRANNNKWVHVLCAVAVLEARFVNISERSPVDLSGIPLQRFKLKCYYCKKREKKVSGCCVQCSHGRCPTAYHPTCAQAAGVLMQPDDWPFVVHVTCCRHKGPVPIERDKASMLDLAVGQKVICKHKNGRYYQCDVVQLSNETFYEVNFDDGSFSDNLFPEDIVSRDCAQVGPPPPGDVVQVRWTDGLVYGAKFVSTHVIQMYLVEFEDGSQLTAKRDDVYTLDEQLPKRVKSRLSKASDMRFDGIFEETEILQESKRQRVINSRYRGDYIEPVIYRAIME